MNGTTDPIVLRECRRIIPCDRDAEEIAAAIQRRGVLVENMRQHIYDHLVECWDPIPDWDDPAFIQVVEAVVDPTAPKIASFEAARTAYDLLDYPEQNLLKLKSAEGLAEKGIAQILRTPVDQVTRDAESAKKTFWQLFTRERWSTLTYFLEELCEEVDSSSSEMLKVESEYLAAKAAYNSLDEIGRAVLRQRCLEGLSVKEIAAKQRTSLVEVSDILTDARADFYKEFLEEIYDPTPIKIRENKDDINDARDYHHDAYNKLYETLYKFIPENFRGWLNKTGPRFAQASVKKNKHRVHLIKELPDEGHEEKSGNEKLRRLELERKRWFELLTRTAVAILGLKKPEKKLHVFVHYILQPALNQLWGGAKARGLNEFQNPGEAMAIAHVLGQYRSKATQAEIGDVIGATDRAIHNYVNEIRPLMKKYAKEAGIADAEFRAAFAHIKESDAKKKRG